MAQRRVYYVSDGTAITAENFSKGLLSQFPSIEFKSKTYPFVDSIEKAHQTIDEIKAVERNGCRPLVFYTIIKEEISEIFQQSDMLAHGLFEQFIKPLELELGVTSSHQANKNHSITEQKDYKNRIDAINYTLNNDDGMNTENYDQADVILLGASRSGKTPTCLYLAMNFCIKAANYPIVENDIDSNVLPKALQKWQSKCFGLTTNPQQLSKIRQERMPGSQYAKLKQCQYEISQIESMYFKERVIHINTSNISIEEISTHIISQLGLHR